MPQTDGPSNGTAVLRRQENPQIGKSAPIRSYDPVLLAAPARAEVTPLAIVQGYNIVYQQPANRDAKSEELSVEPVGLLKAHFLRYSNAHKLSTG